MQGGAGAGIGAGQTKQRHALPLEHIGTGHGFGAGGTDLQKGCAWQFVTGLDCHGQLLELR